SKSFLSKIQYILFFSRKRRHTRFSRDWSSDVCSSDLITSIAAAARRCATPAAPACRPRSTGSGGGRPRRSDRGAPAPRPRRPPRSEERRVGKECRDTRNKYKYKKT